MTCNNGTCRKCLSKVQTGTFLTSAAAEIQMSFIGIGVPCCLNTLYNIAYLRLSSRPTGKNSTASSSSSSSRSCVPLYPDFVETSNPARNSASTAAGIRSLSYCPNNSVKRLFFSRKSINTLVSTTIALIVIPSPTCQFWKTRHHPRMPATCRLRHGTIRQRI